jgi:hypothetical protein
MKTMNSQGRNLLGAGVVAGLAGTGVMMAMRSFDERFAPQTIPKAAIDKGFQKSSAKYSAIWHMAWPQLPRVNCSPKNPMDPS